jgi:photosystem II stability/assembly factor-like uncharacterized protein
MIGPCTQFHFSAVCDIHDMGALPRWAAGLLICGMLSAADPPVKVTYACPVEELESFGLSCSAEDPCQVFLELSSVEAVGDKLFATGNLHTKSTVMYSVLLASEDGGKTWSEPVKRIRAAVLEQIQFIDFGTGWISGQAIEPLPKDPFLLLTTDGGKTWRNRPIFEESRFGSIAQFWFESRTVGELVVDHAERGGTRHELYSTNTGGENWDVKESTTKAVKLKGGRDESSLRLRVDPTSKAYRIERRGTSWETVATFAINVTDCK